MRRLDEERGRGHSGEFTRGETWRGDLLQRVEVEIFLRRDVGTVRAVEAGGDEERPVAVLLQQLDRLRGDFAVGVLRVGGRRGVERERAAEAALRREIGQRLLLFFVDTLGV